MRLKQLLGILLLPVVLATMAAAAVSHLTDVKVAPQDNATTVTIQASGVFTHTEYRPSDNLLLVDLVGVSAGRMEGKAQAVKMPGVTSYRVLGFKGAGGTEVARVELTLARDAGVHISEANHALLVTVTLPGGSANAAPAAEMPPPEPAAKPAEEPQARASRPVVIQTVAVARGKGGMNVEILGTGAMTPKAMKLTAPDRVVIDVPNAVPLRKREIAVNSGDIKSVRVARYQADPPVTRVVVDLAANKDFEVVPSGRKLTVKLRPAAEASQPATAPAPATTPAAVEAAKAAPAAPEPPQQEAAAAAPETAAPAATPTQQGAVAQSFVVVEPEYKPKQETTPQAEMKPASRAEDAAAKLGTPQQEVPLVNVPQPSAALMPSTAAITAAMAQQAPAAGAQTAAAARPKFTGEPISVNLKDVDLKDFFRLIHEISGLNIVLDPNVKGSLTLVLDNVPWDQALDIVLKNNGLQKELDGNVLRIATLETMRKEADAQRAQIEAKALADPKVTVTRVLSYAHSKDVVPVIKKFLSQRGEIISDDRINALIIQDIPSVFPAVDRLLTQLDRKTPEVEIEARVIAATRNFARDIGFQMGFGWGNNVSAVGGAGSAGTSPLTTTGLTPTYIHSGGSIPLFSNLPAVAPTSGLSFINATNNYRLDAILTMAEDRGLLKILSRPRVVTQNNITAVVKQGVRIPVVTLAQLGGPPTTSYVDAFLRLTVTPQITAESTIFLAVDVENTTPDFSRQVSGNPTLLTQQAVTQVLVSDGGTVVIGGVIQTQNSVTIQQVPLLGSIPGLGNLFKRRAVSTSTQELIFFITPKIIQT
ncbi:MAG TPA: type IV pilus secretin PilQ [Terriglobales bacterium]|nr:type IV pilus secretin PilQ [Terriglobales bacterium]